MNGRWFRFYDDVITDPKVMQLSVAMRWHWVMALCCASKGSVSATSRQGVGDVLPSARQDIGNGVVSTRAIALALHVRHKRAQQIMDQLVAVGLFEKVENADTYTPHNWNGRQYKSDLSTERVKRFRNVSSAVSETAPEQIQNRSERVSKPNNDIIKLSNSCTASLFSIRPGTPEWDAWERYYRDHKKPPRAVQLAMERVKEGQQKTMTVPAKRPEEFDSSYAAALELKLKLDQRVP